MKRATRLQRNALPTLAIIVATLVFGPCHTKAATSNGNDFALYYIEAKSADDKTTLFEDAEGRPHFFRYLQIMELDEVEGEGIHITAFEPASYMDVKFVITKAVSLALLREDPASKVGDAIAVTGKLVAVDAEKNVIKLEGTIVRHKDRLSPKMGKELLGEVDPGAVFYSYTAGSRPVNLSYRDRDLLQHRDRIVEEKGADGWVEFLETEVAKRKQERAAAAAENSTSEPSGEDEKKNEDKAAEKSESSDVQR